MPRALASLLSLLFFLGIAAVLSIPIVASSAELVLRPQRFEGLVGLTSSTTGTAEELEATLDEGRLEGEPWAIQVTERGRSWCLAFRLGVIAPDDRTEGLMCTEVTSAEPGMSQFIPASDELDRSLLVAALSSEVQELRLGATDDLPLEGGLYSTPSNFATDATVLVVFLPPGADLVSATAADRDGEEVDVSRLVDQVDAY